MNIFDNTATGKYAGHNIRLRNIDDATPVNEPGQAFMQDLHEHYKMEHHLKKTDLFNKAVEMGHSYGPMGIANYYGLLVDLVR